MPADAPATSQEEARFDEQPSVLQKLQKWGDYEAFGGAVCPTKFLPMKTPLGAEILENWNLELPPRHPLSVDYLLRAQAAEGRQVGMIIDLSNHETLYGADLVPLSVKYERVPLIAKVFPTQTAVNKVIEIADKFWGEHPDFYIAIHCAYGFNRTGFVVCSYLVQACNLTVQDALESFAAARPPGIRHEQFVAELHKRYVSSNAPGMPIANLPSLTDLRGFVGPGGLQQVGSLQSDFLGVAEHLHERHPSLADRLTRSTQEDSQHSASDRAGSPPKPPPPAARIPPAKTRAALAAVSAGSLETGTSTCESLNNESLDLDERDIYKQFANRQLMSAEASTAAANGHHRRKGVVAHLLPVQSEESSRSSQSSPSPFSNFRSGADAFASGLRAEAAGGAEAPAGQSTQVEASEQQPRDAGPGVGGQTHPVESVDEDGRQPRRSRLARGPVTERVLVKNCNSEDSGDEKQQPDRSRRRLLPCRLM